MHREKKIKVRQWKLDAKDIDRAAQIEAAYYRIKNHSMHYWQPILSGLVQISKQEYDNAGPTLLFELNALATIKAEIEEEKYNAQTTGNSTGEP